MLRCSSASLASLSLVLTVLGILLHGYKGSYLCLLRLNLLLLLGDGREDCLHLIRGNVVILSSRGWHHHALLSVLLVPLSAI